MRSLAVPLTVLCFFVLGGIARREVVIMIVQQKRVLTCSNQQNYCPNWFMGDFYDVVQYWELSPDRAL